MVAYGELAAPLAIGRDHLDCGSVASPYRETEAMLDGSDAIADWPLLNAMVNVASGASWVSLHHGGGVGMGRSIHAGQVTVADGTKLAGEKIRRVLTNDPGMGVIRHVDAGYDIAESVADERGVRMPMREGGVLARWSRTGESASFQKMWATCGPSGGTPTPGVTGASPGPAPTPTAGPGSGSRPRPAGSPTSSTGTATSGRGSGDPDAGDAVVTGSHLDSVPDGGAFDGPLGVVSSFAALDELRARGVTLAKPFAIVNFGDEEGARFGLACVGSRLAAGELGVEQAHRLTDGDGITLPQAMAAAGYDPDAIGPDPERLARIGAFVELHVEQGRALDLSGDQVGIASAIWPHGRWRFDFRGEANHAGTTRLVDRRDPMLTYAETVLAARREARLAGAVATFGKIAVEPNGVNAIPSLVRGWLDSRAADQETLDTVVDGIEKAARARTPGNTASTSTWSASPSRPSSSSTTPCATNSPASWARTPTSRSPSSVPAPDTTPGFCPDASRPPCCSCATPPVSRTPRPSTPRRTTAWPG